MYIVNLIKMERILIVAMMENGMIVVMNIK